MEVACVRNNYQHGALDTRKIKVARDTYTHNMYFYHTIAYYYIALTCYTVSTSNNNMYMTTFQQNL